MNLDVLLVVFLIISQLNFIISTNHDCSSPWIKENNICVYYGSGLYTWHSARSHCRFFDGDLLYIDDSNENAIISRIIQSLKKPYYERKPLLWLDIRKNPEDGTWYWSRNNKTIQNPSKQITIIHTHTRCACLRLSDYSWKDCDCTEKLHFMCRKEVKEEINLKNNSENKTLFLPTHNHLKQLIDKEDDNIDTNDDQNSNNHHHHRHTPVLANLIQKTASYQTSNETKSIVSNETLPEALPLKGSKPTIKTLENDQEMQLFNVETENVEDMERELMNFANYLMSAEFNEKYLKNLNDTQTKQNLTETSDDDIIDEKFPNLNLLREDLQNIPDTNLVNANDNSVITSVANGSLNTNDINLTAQQEQHDHVHQHKIALVKIKILKNANFYQTTCPNGFGYYSVSNVNCTQYKKCENISKYYAIISLYKCINNNGFNFKDLDCTLSSAKCDSNESIFIPL